MKKLTRRLVSLLLAAVMLCGMMPMTMFAAEETGSTESVNTSESCTLNLGDYSHMFAEGCITIAANIWQARAVNWHYQIPLEDFEDYNLVTITANAATKCYIAFFTERMVAHGPISYAQGWSQCLVMDPGTSQELAVPEDAQYLYILNNNAAGDSLLPESVVFKAHEHTYETTVTAPNCTAGYTTYTCTTCGYSYTDNYIEAAGHNYEGLSCTVCGKKIQQLAQDELCITVTPDYYWTISNIDTEKLACAPGVVNYGGGNFAVAYLADDINTVETESSTTIVCRLGLFNIKDPENGQFYDIATAGQAVGSITIGNKAPYEPNLLKLSEDKLLVLFNLHTADGQYVYYSAVFDTGTNEVLSYQPLTLDGKEWTPGNIAASYNAIADRAISSNGPTGSMVFTSQIIQHDGYYYGYCGGICAGFSGILVRSTDGINWTSVTAPEAVSEMAGVIECGFQFLDDCVYFCMRDISSGVYHCSYDFSAKEKLVGTRKIPDLTTSKPLAFIQNGKLYLVVNKATNDESTVARRNTALFYQVDPKTCELTLAKQVFCGDGIAYHAVVNDNGVNYWSFHTDARRINPYTQGRSNLAFLKMPSLNATEEHTHTYKNGICTGCGDGKAAAISRADDQVYYDSITEAMESAQTGDTVKLLADTESFMTNLYQGITLDLNGYTLETDYFVAFNGNNIIDSSESNSGLLVVAEDRFAIANNSQLPVKTTDGYKFYEVLKINEKAYTGDQYGKYVFQPIIEPAVHQELPKGMEATDVQIIVDVTYKSGDDKTGKREFVYSDSFVETFVNSYNAETGKYSKMFTLTIGDASKFETLTFTTRVVFADKVEFASPLT